MALRPTALWGVGTAALVVACSRPPPPATVAMNWQPVDSLDERLPPTVRVFAGRNEALPLQSWYVRAETHDSSITAHVVESSDTTDRRETVSDFARDNAGCVAVNGGYFNPRITPAVHAGLLYVDHRLLAPATETVVRDSVRYETARATIGIEDDGDIDLGWVITHRDTLFAWAEPPENRPHHPIPRPPLTTARPWHVRDALGAGPMLVWNSRPRVTIDEEVFFGSAIPEVHPRTAVGRDRDRKLIVLVIDGRQPASRGATLEETATIMRELGASRAMNLDGGGSTALVVNGVLVNRPVGDPSEREVMSALVISCDGR